MSGHVWLLFKIISTISLFAIGGASALIPEFHRQIVEHYRLMDDSAFVHIVALTQLAPGPNILIVSFIGWRVAALPGLLVSTFAIVGPPGALAFLMGKLMETRRDAHWMKSLKIALAPVVVGLTLASGLVTARAADHNAVSVMLTAASAAFMIAYRRNPLWVIAAGASLGVLAYHFGLMPNV